MQENGHRAKDFPNTSAAAMIGSFEAYGTRRITFEQLALVDDWRVWRVKVYSITNKKSFGSREILESALSALPDWLSIPRSSTLPTYALGFLVVHEAREGVWALFNWWTGGEMIETKVFFADFKNPSVFGPSPYGTNALVCVWELEVFVHERQAWIDHILSKADDPDIEGYLKSHLILTT